MRSHLLSSSIIVKTWNLQICKKNNLNYGIVGKHSSSFIYVKEGKNELLKDPTAL